MFSLEKVATVPSMDPPHIFRNSANAVAYTRKTSIENLVEENLKSIERSVILQKIGEDQAAGVEHDHSFILNTSARDIEAKAKEIVQAALRDKLIGASHHYTTPQERDSIESQVKSTGNELAYEKVRELYPDGSLYEGEKQYGKRHGKGIFHSKEGFKYDGNWTNGVMEGYGVLWLHGNKIYEGEWRNNAFDGRGTAYNHEVSEITEFDGSDFRLLKNGWTKFEGLFILGAKQGLGTLHLANGDTFVGNFERDVLNGRGSYTAKNSKPFIGLWKENVLVEKF